MFDKNTAIILYCHDQNILQSLNSISKNSIKPRYIYIIGSNLTQFNIEKTAIDNVEIVYCNKYENRSKSLNKCIENIPKEIIFLGFLNSPDIYEKNKIEESINICKKYPVVGCVVNDTYINDQTKIPIKKKSFNIKTLLTSYCYDPNYFVRLDLLKKGNLKFNEDLQYREDYEMIIKISKLGLIFHTPQILNSYNNLTINLEETKKQEEIIRKNV